MACVVCSKYAVAGAGAGWSDMFNLSYMSCFVFRPEGGGARGGGGAGAPVNRESSSTVHAPYGTPLPWLALALVLPGSTLCALN
jgi:hypothetical protein